MAEPGISLPRARAAWGGADFAATLKAELEALPHAALPLQAALAYASAVADEPIVALVAGAEADAHRIHARVVILYAGVIAGCNCADDPSPIDSRPERCELRVEIDRIDAGARFHLLDV